MYDIAIIGLGPAGATLARLLDKKYKVLAIDKKNTKVVKCCGGLLSPDAQKILSSFDICLPNEALSDPQIFSVKTSDYDNNIERFYQRFYINMNRDKFDKFMVSLIPDNVKIYQDSVCTKIERTENAFNLDIKSKEISVPAGEASSGSGKTIRIIKRKEQARIVIGADGANSIVRKTFYKKNKIKKYAAIQEWHESNKTSPFYSCIFDKSITDSYSWTISKDNFFIIGGAFPVQESAKRFEMLKELIKNKGISYGKTVKREGCVVFLNKGPGGTCTGKKGAYLAGEAAGMISPSSLEGISYSMESAKILAQIINDGMNRIGSRYFWKTFGIRVNLILKLFKMPFMYNRFLRMLVMKSGIRSIKK